MQVYPFTKFKYISKIIHGHPRIMLYKNFVELETMMLLAKFQDFRRFDSGKEDFLKVFAIYSPGVHLAHAHIAR